MRGKSLANALSRPFFHTKASSWSEFFCLFWFAPIDGTTCLDISTSIGCQYTLFLFPFLAHTTPQIFSFPHPARPCITHYQSSEDYLPLSFVISLFYLAGRPREKIKQDFIQSSFSFFFLVLGFLAVVKVEEEEGRRRAPIELLDGHKCFGGFQLNHGGLTEIILRIVFLWVAGYFDRYPKEQGEGLILLLLLLHRSFGCSFVPSFVPL